MKEQDVVQVQAGSLQGAVGVVHSVDDSDSTASVYLLEGRQTYKQDNLRVIQLEPLGVSNVHVGAVIKNSEGLEAVVREVTDDYIYLGEWNERSKTSAKRIAFTRSYFASMYAKNRRTINRQGYTLDDKALQRLCTAYVVEGINDTDYKIQRIHTRIDYYDTQAEERVHVVCTDGEQVVYTNGSIAEDKNRLADGKTLACNTISKAAFVQRCIRNIEVGKVYKTRYNMQNRLQELGFLLPNITA